MRLLLHSLICLCLVSCTTIHYFDIQTELITYGKGYMHFVIENIDSSIRTSQDPQVQNDPKFEAFNETVKKYSNFPMDSTMTYLILVLQHISRSDIPPATLLKADSFFIRLTHQQLPQLIVSFKQETFVGGNSNNAKVIYVEPIPIPKDYNQDFEIEFILSIYNEADSTLLERRPIKVLAKHKSKKYSPFIHGK